MKRTGIILLYSLLFCDSGKLFAQSAEFGIRLMPTVSSFDLIRTSTGEVVGGEATLGYGAGGFLALNFTDHIGLQSEVIYNTLSQKYAEPDLHGNVKLHYVNVPVLFSLNTNKRRLINFNVVAGPQLGMSAGTEVDLDILSEGNDRQEPELIAKRGDLGLAYGAGFDIGLFPLKAMRIGLGVRNVVSLIDLGNSSMNDNHTQYYMLDKTRPKTMSGYIGLSILL